jgi:hypothetical protein
LSINESAHMTIWMLRIGIALVVVGLALLSPIGDLLPIDLWLILRSLFTAGSMPADTVFYRLAPSEPSSAVELVLIGVGLALVGASLYVRQRK